MLQRLADAGLVTGKTVGIDATTLEANAALRSIVRRDTDESYHDFLAKLAQASGIKTPTRADLARIDRHRKKKGSNDDWTQPHDPDAKITKMKDGRTHLAHKAEHAVDLETSAPEIPRYVSAQNPSMVFVWTAPLRRHLRAVDPRVPSSSSVL